MSTLEEQLFDDVIHNAIDLLRLSAGLREKVIAHLRKMEKEITDNLNAGELGEYSRAELNEFLVKVDAIIADYYAPIPESLGLPTVARAVAETTASSLEIVLGIDAISLPKQSYFRALASEILIEGVPQADWWKAQSDDLARKFKTEMRVGLANSETNKQLIDRVTGKNDNVGIMQTAENHAASLVQTSVQSVANDARRATYQANSDVVKGLEQVSTLDGQTSLTCVAYSGCRWNLEYQPIDGWDLPWNGGTPRHFNCRSTERPLLKTFRDLGLNIDEAKVSTRASEDGQVAADTSFDAFLKRKGTAYQDKVLGKGRADLWRAGKITLRDLLDAKGRPLSLYDIQNNVLNKFNGAAYAKQFDDPTVTPASVLAKFPADTKAKIEATERKLATLVPTDKLHTKDGVYTAERAALHDKILYEGVEGYDPETGKTKFYPGLLDKKTMLAASGEETPTFTILGGRGGSGKSAFDGEKFPEAKVYDRNKVVLFDSDVVKHMLPEFKGFNANQVHEESSFILDAAIRQAREAKVNVVLDGTLKSLKSALGKVDEFRGSGYNIEAHYMFLPRQEAAARAVARYLGPTGRFVPTEIILSNVDNEANFDAIAKLANNWSFRDNNVARGAAPKLVAKKRLPDDD